MGTLVCFHAHPDDESIATGGLMAKAAAAGHRVVLVVATRGEQGEPVPGVLEPDEQLGLRRTAETYRSAEALGAQRVEFLGYVDSGMVDTPTSEHPWCFWQADVEQAAHRLAAILREEEPDVLTVYDDNGGYGHPDHIQVHRVGVRAAELVGVDQVFESTMNRTALIAGIEAQVEAGNMPQEMLDGIKGNEGFGKPAEEITHQVDCLDFVGDKRASMLCHRSQMGDDHFMISMPDDHFAMGFGTEWFIARGGPAPEGSISAELFLPRD